MIYAKKKLKFLLLQIQFKIELRDDFIRRTESGNHKSTFSYFVYLSKIVSEFNWCILETTLVIAIAIKLSRL